MAPHHASRVDLRSALVSVGESSPRSSAAASSAAAAQRSTRCEVAEPAPPRDARVLARERLAGHRDEGPSARPARPSAPTDFTAASTRATSAAWPASTVRSAPAWSCAREPFAACWAAAERRAASFGVKRGVTRARQRA